MRLDGALDRARRASGSDAGRLVLRTLYYLAVIAAVALVQGRGHFTAPPYVYQGF
jgi:hypothetical protein